MKPFDLERLRRNWDRAAGSPAAPLPERLAQVALAQDPYPEAERVLERIASLSRDEFGRHERNLKPFFDAARALLARLRENAASPPGSAAEGQSKADALRLELLKVLNDLEDLLEVYAGIGLR